MKASCLFLVSFFFLSTSALFAQQIPAFPGSMNLGSMATRNVAEKLQKEPIITSFKHVDTLQPVPSWFGDTLIAQPLAEMPKNDSGAYILPAGFYEMTVKSYCIRAGTHGPSHGDGYCYAPLLGKKKELMQSILQKAQSKPKIRQQDVQVLLWAIISRTRFQDMNPHIQAVTMTLLNPKEILELNNGAIGFVPVQFLARSVEGLSPFMATILRAENEMRRMFSNANAVYSDFERMAVLSGMAPVDRPDIKRGRWSKHPCGYYVRYFPEHYSKTRVQVYVPESALDKITPCHDEAVLSNGETIIGLIFNAIGSVAVPANTGSQRLLQSNEIWVQN